jgi:CPA2 family monovalent cation:H+ antiporter-2
LSVRAIAVPGALVQIIVASALGAGLAHLLGWSLGAGLIFGLALSVASTVVVLRSLQERRLLDTERGRIAVGWLVVEDLAMVLVLVFVPALGIYAIFAVTIAWLGHTWFQKTRRGFADVL